MRKIPKGHIPIKWGFRIHEVHHEKYHVVLFTWQAASPSATVAARLLTPVRSPLSSLTTSPLRGPSSTMFNLPMLLLPLLPFVLYLCIQTIPNNVDFKGARSCFTVQPGLIALFPPQKQRTVQWRHLLQNPEPTVCKFHTIYQIIDPHGGHLTCSEWIRRVNNYSTYQP